MEPNQNNYGPPAELPQPIDSSPGQSVPEQGTPAQPEIRGMHAPASAVHVQQKQTPVIPVSPVSQAIGTDAAVPAAVNDASTAGLMADDADLIEKEWVTRAKTIVMQTKDDPYAQNREMNKVKADYLKKRYNKDLKVSEN